MRGLWWIYILGPESGWPVKIGYTKNMIKRAEMLQTAHWERLVLHKRYAVVSKSQAIKLERLVHKRLTDHKLLGEWFNIFGEDAIKAVDEAIKYREYLEPSLKTKANLIEQFSS